MNKWMNAEWKVVEVESDCTIPCKVFRLPSAPMRTSNSYWDTGCSAGLIRAFHPISTRHALQFINHYHWARINVHPLSTFDLWFQSQLQSHPQTLKLTEIVNSLRFINHYHCTRINVHPLSTFDLLISKSTSKSSSNLKSEFRTLPLNTITIIKDVMNDLEMNGTFPKKWEREKMRKKMTLLMDWSSGGGMRSSKVTLSWTSTPRSSATFSNTHCNCRIPSQMNKQTDKQNNQHEMSFSSQTMETMQTPWRSTTIQTAWLTDIFLFPFHQ